ncbi:MAG: DUF2236 domain-containing protein [Nocardioidaceae bacterium]|nr:DUF2236 domain-containing protein [Nocardioidaceae bacterium]
MSPVARVRHAVGAALFHRVAGPEGPARRARIHGSVGPRWFEPDSPIRVVHGDASMFVGGIRALLLQSLHPVAMAAVAQHSGYRGDPWGRLQRTSTFLATTTFGTANDAQRAVDVVRSVHERVRGVTDDGVAYTASDPHLLTWVHVAEVDSFLAAHQRYGARPLSPGAADEYVAQAAQVAWALGAVEVPTTVAELNDTLASYRPELRGTPEAREAARFMLLRPPLPVPARAGYAFIAAAGVAMMPRWTRRQLRLPWLPLAEATLVRAAGVASTSTIRWAMSPG